jgi:hypothetical protein
MQNSADRTRARAHMQTAVDTTRGDKSTHAKFCRQNEETTAHIKNSADRTGGDKSTYAKFCRQNGRRQEHTCKILQTTQREETRAHMQTASDNAKNRDQ